MAGSRSVTRKGRVEGSVGIAPYHRRMSPGTPARSAAPRGPSRASRRVAIGVGAALAVAALLAGCGGEIFDPDGPCTADGSAPGAYPELEAVVPTALNGSPPSDLDSGRACTPAGLGTLATHGVNEMRFAGATWAESSDSGTSLAVFTDPDGPAMQPAWMAEFYEAGARAASKVDSIATSEYPVGPSLIGRRVDVLNGESFQTIVVWERDGRTAAALVANAIREIQTREAHDRDVRAAVDAFGG